MNFLFFLLLLTCSTQAQVVNIIQQASLAASNGNWETAYKLYSQALINKQEIERIWGKTLVAHLYYRKGHAAHILATKKLEKGKQQSLKLAFDSAYTIWKSTK